MYERFTERARQVVQLASTEAYRLNECYVGTEHILLGLLKEGSSDAAHLLKVRGITSTLVLAELKTSIEHEGQTAGPATTDETGQPIGVVKRSLSVFIKRIRKPRLSQTPTAKRMIELAMEECRKLNHTSVSTEHVLLGLLQETEGVAADTLKNLGLDLGQLRQQVMVLLELTVGVGDECGDIADTTATDTLRLTSSARNVFRSANREALRLNQEYIGTEHVLLGLIAEDGCTAVTVLDNLDVQPQRIRHDIEEIVTPGTENVAMRKLPFTPRAKEVIGYAVEEAHLLKHNYLGTEHILLGLLHEREGVAAALLMNYGLNSANLRLQVLNFLVGGNESK